MSNSTVYNLLPDPHSLFPNIHPADVFQKHPELLEWYKTCIKRPLEDIRNMQMHRTPDQQTHVWVNFHSDHDVVGYRSFQDGPDGKLVPLPDRARKPLASDMGMNGSSLFGAWA